MHYFDMKKSKIFWGGGIGTGTPPPYAALPFVPSHRFSSLRRSTPLRFWQIETLHISTRLYYLICKIQRSWQICDLLLTPKSSKAPTESSVRWTPRSPCAPFPPYKSSTSSNRATALPLCLGWNKFLARPWLSPTYLSPSCQHPCSRYTETSCR